MQTQMTPYFIVFGIRIKCRTESAHCFRGATFDHRSKRQLILSCQKRQLIPPTFDPRVGQDQLSVGSNVAKSRIECRYLGSYVVGIKCRWYQLSPHRICPSHGEVNITITIGAKYTNIVFGLYWKPFILLPNQSYQHKTLT